jgi:hypothetical protein
MATITTIHGDMDESDLTPNHHDEVTPNGVANVTEYLHQGEVVHRSVHFTFNQNYQPEIVQP